MISASRIGILGGTFDPIHVGHLDAALVAQEALALDEIVIVPSLLTPHKSSTRQVSWHHRFMMSELATTDMPNMRVSDIERKTSSSSPSYTSLTLQHFSDIGYSSQQLFFIIGSDAFLEIEQWHNYPSLLEQSHFIVISRSGLSCAALREQLPSLSSRMQTIPIDDENIVLNQTLRSPLVWLVEAKTRNVSSSDVRKLLSRNESTEGLLPRAVKSYISKHHLYPDTSETKV